MKDDNKTKKQLVHELTELRSQSAVLEKSESAEKYRSLVENIRDVIYELDSQGVVLYISPAIRDMLGYDSTEIVGKNFIELAHKDDLSSQTEWFSELRKGIESPYEYRVINKSGELKWARTKTRPIMEDGLFKGARGILIDVTEQRRAEEALRESEELFRSYLEYAPDGVCVSDLEGNFLYGNLKCEEIIGYRREELLGKNYLKLNILSENNRNKAVRLLQANMEGKSTGPNEIDLISKEGGLIPVEINTNVVQRMGQGIVLSFVRDITNRKRAEEELQQTLESLRKALSTTIQVMVSAVEIRDPYTAGHQIRSAGLARAISTDMGLPQEKIDGIRMAGSIHDIGKLSIPAEILSKPTKLTNSEFSLIKEHSQKGYEMLKEVESPWPLAEIVYQHHERMDGSGYPRNLKGDDIIMEARVLAVSDVVEAMASHRPYRPGLGIDKALEEIEKNKGTLYDNAVADTCLRLFREKGFQLEEARF